MKKKIIALTTLIAASAMSVSAFAADVTVLLNGREIESDVPAQIIDNRAMIPMRAIFEAMDANVSFDAEEKKVTAVKDDITVEMSIDKKNLYVNGNVTYTDAAPIISDSRTLAPTRFVSEAFGYYVIWDADTKTVKIEDITPGQEVYVSTYEELAAAAKVPGNTVYVQNDIKMGDRLQLDTGHVSIIGVPKADGSLPVLDFIDMKGSKDITKEASSDADVGIRIVSSNNVVKNLVIENAHDNGIQLKGAGVTDNLIENCIVRYSNDSGIQTSSGAYGNTFKGVYSYRNCDVFTCGGNADGFAIKLGSGIQDATEDEVVSGANIMTDCYAWENGDDGWDSFDKEDNGNFWTYSLTYENCMCWNNGTLDNCIGYTYFEKGESLDERLPFMVRLKALYPDKYEEFKTAYNNGTFSEKSFEAYLSALDATFGTIPVQGKDDDGKKIKVDTAFSALPDVWGGNPNGFKFGSKYTLPNSTRRVTNCIAFDHKKYGFDKNNSGAHIYAENCVSFNNLANYHLEGYTANKWENVYGANGGQADDLPQGITVAQVSEETQNAVREAANKVAANSKANIVEYSDIFGKIF